MSGIAWDQYLNKIDVTLHNYKQSLKKTYSKLDKQEETVKVCQQINIKLDMWVKQLLELIMKLYEQQEHIEQEKQQRQCIIAEMLEKLLSRTIFNENLVNKQKPEQDPIEQAADDKEEDTMKSPIHITIELTEQSNPPSMSTAVYVRDYTYPPFNTEARKEMNEDMILNQYKAI